MIKSLPYRGWSITYSYKHGYRAKWLTHVIKAGTRVELERAIDKWMQEHHVP